MKDTARRDDRTGVQTTNNRVRNTTSIKTDEGHAGKLNIVDVACPTKKNAWILEAL